MDRLSTYLLGVMCGIIMGIFLCWEVVYPIWIEAKQQTENVKVLEKQVQVLELKQKYLEQWWVKEQTTKGRR